MTWGVRRFHQLSASSGFLQWQWRHWRGWSGVWVAIVYAIEWSFGFVFVGALFVYGLYHEKPPWKNGESQSKSLFSIFRWHSGRGKVACQTMFPNYSPSRSTDSKLKKWRFASILTSNGFRPSGQFPTILLEVLISWSLFFQLGVLTFYWLKHER